MLLSELQRDHKRWLNHNFPNQESHDGLLGLTEEVGELAEAGKPIPRELSIALGKLAHAHLKFQQGIRGIDEKEYRKQAGDAIGDIVIYLASYCNTNGFNLQLEVIKAWNQVKARDWRKDPENAAD